MNPTLPIITHIYNNFAFDISGQDIATLTTMNMGEGSFCMATGATNCMSTLSIHLWKGCIEIADTSNPCSSIWTSAWTYKYIHLWRAITLCRKRGSSSLNKKVMIGVIYPPQPKPQHYFFLKWKMMRTISPNFVSNRYLVCTTTQKVPPHCFLFK